MFMDEKGEDEVLDTANLLTKSSVKYLIVKLTNNRIKKLEKVSFF